MTRSLPLPLADRPVGPAMPPGDRLDIFARKLLSHSLLTTRDRQAIQSLPCSMRTLAPGDTILREGERARTCPLLLSGFAYRGKRAANGMRQIVALKFPGDSLDFQSLYLCVADHELCALTAVDLAFVPLAALDGLARQSPAFARAILVDMLIEASIGREWLLNIGRRDALSRLAHFLCELVCRLRWTAMVAARGLDVPLTQIQLADLLGLTPVHINRTLKVLEAKGAVQRNGRRLCIRDFGTLRGIAEFSDLYLHQSALPPIS